MIGVEEQDPAVFFLGQGVRREQGACQQEKQRGEDLPNFARNSHDGGLRFGIKGLLSV